MYTSLLCRQTCSHTICKLFAQLFADKKLDSREQLVCFSSKARADLKADLKADLTHASKGFPVKE